MKTINIVCIFISLFFVSGCVAPASFVALENRVAAMEMENNRQLSRKSEQVKESAVQNEQYQSKLERDLESIKKKLNEGHLLTKEEYAELIYDIQSITQNIQRIEGLIEVINHNFDEYSQTDKVLMEEKITRLDNAISKNYEKVIRLEKYMGFEPSDASRIAPELLPSTEMSKEVSEKLTDEQKKNPEQELYDFAKKLFDDGDKKNARIQFKNFINKYPDSKNADNARFWIADSFYSEKWFDKAILEYQKVLEDYPNSNKLAAARLKQGYAFAELGEKANARLILKELLKKHPDTNEAKFAKEKLKSLN